MSLQAIKVASKKGSINNGNYYDFSELTNAEKFQFINSVCIVQLDIAYYFKKPSFLYYTAAKLINIDRVRLKSELQGLLLGSQIVKIFANIFFS